MFCRNSHTRTAFHLYGSSYDKPNVSSNWMFSGTHYMWMASNQCCCGCVDEHLELIAGCQKANIIYRPEHHSHSLALAEVGGWTMGMCVWLVTNRRLFASVTIIPRLHFLQKWVRNIQGVTCWLGLMSWPLNDDNTAIFIGHHRRGECLAIALFGSYLITWAPILAIEQCFRCEEGVRINRKSERRLRRSGSGPMGKYVVGRKHNSPSLEVHFGAERKKCTFPLALVG